MRWIAAENSLAEPGFKMQHFNYFLTLFLHLIFSALSLYKWESMAQNHRVILYLNKFFPVFLLCTKLNPPNVQIQPTVCIIQDHFFLIIFCRLSWWYSLQSHFHPSCQANAHSSTTTTSARTAKAPTYENLLHFSETSLRLLVSLHNPDKAVQMV